MSKDVSIRVSNLGKCYNIFRYPQDRLKQMLWSSVSGLSSSVPTKKYYDEFWALNDVNFEIRKGEALGIIGQNGSGKSTLLQLICGTLAPTTGSVEVNGRVAALLELGAGFNPEFTGKENVYLNCTVLGLSQKEIDQRYDEIVSFADIGEFIHQPVKTYSSGMYVRLAFAAAINVDPDVLIVDEALAVGDVKFQKKCFDRMYSIRNSGKTLILVSHDTETIKNFSSTTLLLEKGKVLFHGPPKEAALRYFQLLFPVLDNKPLLEEKQDTDKKNSDDISKSNEMPVVEDYCLEIIPTDDEKSFGCGGAQIQYVRIYGLQKPNIFYGGDPLSFEIKYSWVAHDVEQIVQKQAVEKKLMFGIQVENKKCIALTDLATSLLMPEEQPVIDPTKCGFCILRYQVQLPLLSSGDYFFSPEVAVGVQENLVALKNYANLIHLHCLSRNQYQLGLMKWDYSVEVLAKG